MNDRDQKAMLLELTVSLDENFEKAKQQKLKRYEKHKREIEFYDAAVRRRGFVENSFLSLLGRLFGYSKKEIKEITVELQETAERASLFIWLKINFKPWLKQELC